MLVSLYTRTNSLYGLNSCIAYVETSTSIIMPLNTRKNVNVEVFLEIHKKMTFIDL